MKIKEFEESFGNIEDFRQEGKVKHNLIEILFVAVIGTIANANSWIKVADFAETKEELLKK